MAECKDIDRALANLARKIDAQNACCEANKQKIAGLEGRIRNLEQGGNKQGQSKPQNLTAIYQRLSKLESYCQSIETLFKQISDFLKPIIAIFK